MVLKQYVLQNLFRSHIRQNDPNTDLHTIYLVGSNKYNIQTWAIMTCFCNFMTLTSVIYGHYILRTDFGPHITSVGERQLKKQCIS